MRVLWFTNTPSLYKQQELGYNGGGWISSLEEAILRFPNIELGICFYDSKTKKVQNGEVTYYPICTSASILKKIKSHFFYTLHQKQEIESFLRIIDDFKPDVIHVFGSENAFALIKEYTNVPLVLHLQGIINPYLNAFFPPGIGLYEYLRFLNLKEYYSKYHHFRFFKRGAIRERKIFQLCENYIGRTDWDMNVTTVLSPRSNYFYCGEILRKSFYDSEAWKLKYRNKIIIATTISTVEYKGFDLILKTAEILKNNFPIDFEWCVFGIKEYPFLEKKLKIKAQDVNIRLMGVVDSDELIVHLLNSDVFVHSSYIDNSPNSVCEAQLLGMPVISTNVGGISSLVENEKTGYLIPANDPYTLACKILDLKKNERKSISLGRNARECALKRHDIESIVNRNVEIYNTILNQ